MLVRDRQAKIINLVSVMPLTVAVMAEMLKVTNKTIRNDIDYLLSRNRVTTTPDVNGFTVKAV